MGAAHALASTFLHTPALGDYPGGFVVAKDGFGVGITRPWRLGIVMFLHHLFLVVERLSSSIVRKALTFPLLVAESGVKWSATDGEGARKEGVAMFLGTYEPKLDAKGRLILPAKFRDELAGGLVITRGQERCLYVFSSAEFERMYVELRRAPLSSKEARDYVRVMLSGASDDIPDKQGRVVIPQTLRSYASLERDIVVIGAGSRVEIWNADAWQHYLADHEQAFAETGSEVVPGLF